MHGSTLVASSFTRLHQNILDAIAGEGDATHHPTIEDSDMNPLAAMIIKKTDSAAVEGMQALQQMSHLFGPHSCILTFGQDFNKGMRP